MPEKPIVIFGAGELAEVADFYFAADSQRQVAAFTIDGAHLNAQSWLGRPLIAFEEIAVRMPPSEYDFFVAVGYSKLNALRQEKCLAAAALGYSLVSYVSSRATIFSNVRHGWNCFILENNTVQPFVTIGNGVTMWSGNHIGHHSSIGDFAFISSHVVISGGVKVGERTFIGVNSTTNDRISIGNRCVIGSGSLMTKDVPDEGVISAEPSKLSPVPSRRLRGF